ncbi:MAG TPA: hypothetical protein VJS45_14810 [Acidimicrobiia bacterium]|nr:hypothetical protein [Acidimicrobiia bacterium]
MTERSPSKPRHDVHHTNGHHAGLAGVGLRRAMSQQHDHILTEARELLAVRDVTAAAAVAGAVLRQPAAARPATVLECRNIVGCALWLDGDLSGAASALEAAMIGGRTLPLLLNHALVAARHDPAAAAESLGRYALETADPRPRIAAVQRALALWCESRGTAGLGPASALPRTLFAALRTLAITTSRAQLAPLGLAGAFGELMAYLHGRETGAEPALRAVLVDAPSACAWVLLGLDYGAAAPEARRAFARQARRLREAGRSGALADLTGALHEVEHGPRPDGRLDQYRIPLSVPAEQRVDERQSFAMALPFSEEQR